ncbi:MAG: asparagine synthetase B [Flavobacteriales bacterium]|nr:asparagine synthetase B [Flavobacteriales bacterium]MAU37445.1 asparagine synthetase B [Flavobacteriales bacterium]|tara:strand:- start:10477 stop:11748 length:1272 start_codon:yes stop_codon:yes gene_type:complete
MIHFKFKKKILLLFFCSFFISLKASYILIPMDESQSNHLKAYGIAYYAINNKLKVDWLLNYKGGSFMIKYHKTIEDECNYRGVFFNVIADIQSNQILQSIASPSVNQDIVRLEKAPKIAIYSPKSKQPWDDAVTMALTYAEIPYDVIYDEEVLSNLLPIYDWLHLHHEDFTGQYGKFYFAFKNATWYKEGKRDAEELANKLGYKKVSEAKLAVAKKIKEFILGGGFLFAMCSATDSYDIALAAEGIDICREMFDGDPMDSDINSKLDFSKTLAFKDFSLIKNPNHYEFSSIDATEKRRLNAKVDFFTLFDFSAKWDPVPTMLCQNHVQVIAGFMGQTTSFKKEYIKTDVLIMGETKATNEARYIHGKLGNGTWTFYGGHDPEDYQHRVGDPKTDLSLHPNSPGYRLILNNILFPAAKKKKLKT